MKTATRHVLKLFVTGLLAALPLAATVAVFWWALSLLVRWLGPDSKVGSVLAAIGLSQLRDRMVPEGIDQAVAGLANMRAQMDLYRRTHGTFATVGSARSACEADESARIFGPFVVRCAYPPGPASFVLHAVGRNALADSVFTLDQTGWQTTLKAPEGWPLCRDRWAVRKDGSC